MAKKIKEDRLLSPKMHVAKRYRIHREPAYWAVFIFLLAAGSILYSFSDIRPSPSDQLLAAPELNTIFGFKITTVLIVFVIIVVLLLIILVSKRLAARQYEEAMPQ